MDLSVEICAAIIAGLLGIAYPILTEVIARLNEKYSSNIIVDLFLEEKVLWLFKRTLILTLILIAVYFLKLKRLKGINFGKFDYLANNSASYLLLISTIFLVIFFFILIDKVLIFYRPNSYTNYLKNQHSLSKEKESGDKYFTALSDLLIYSIKIRNGKIAQTISEFHYKAFKKFRDVPSSIGVEYPAAYYEIIYRAIEELAEISTKRLAFIQVRTAGAIWLLGELKDSQISDLTYSHLWRNTRVSLDYKRDDFLLDYWQTAHQHFNFLLRNIEKQYNRDGEVINQLSVERREAERNRFLEFNFFWGALLLHEKKYECLYQIFTYTTSKPPSYDLLPNKMDDIFYNLFPLTDPYTDLGLNIAWKYSFPKLRGMNADNKVFDAVIHYFALLFLRQYSIVPHYVFMKPLALPNLPVKEHDKQRWIDNLPYFKKVVIRTLANKYLLKKVELDFLEENYYANHGLKNPIAIIDDLILALNGSIHSAAINQKISTAKKQQFIESTKQILTETFSHYRFLQEVDIIKSDFTHLFIIGTMHVADKSSFAEESTVTHLNYDTYLAESLAKKVRKGVQEIFVTKSTSSYLIERSSLAVVLSNLKLSSEFLLVCFGIDYTFDSLETIVLPSSGVHKQSIFIFRKIDAPSLTYNEVPEDQQTLYGLEKVSEDFNIYTSIKDLHQDEKLKEEVASEVNDLDLDKKVLLNISINMEFKWRPNKKCIELRLAERSYEKGILDDIRNILPFDY